MRVPDLPRFLLRIRSVLADRLARSSFHGYRGELTLDFYRAGLRLVFAGGKLVTVEDRQRPPWGGQEQADAAFPPLVFLQMLFGYRHLDQLRAAFPDVWRRDEAAALLQTLLPPATSFILPLD